MDNPIVHKKLPSDFNAASIVSASVPIHLPTDIGDWIHVCVTENDEVPDPRNYQETLKVVKEHTIMIYNTDGLNGDLSKLDFPDLVKINENEPLLVRIHSCCRFGDALYSQNCDCRRQLDVAKLAIKEQGAGIIFYLDQEGRNAGLTMKTAANHMEQAHGIDTSQTYQGFGLKGSDFREYGVVTDALRLLGITKVRLMTNNPAKIQAVRDAGVEVIRQQSQTAATPHSLAYLITKRELMGHLLDEEILDGSDHAAMISKLRSLLPRLTLEHVQELEKIVNGTNIPADPLLIREP
jgi:GTP cyclohydrolase II